MEKIELEERKVLQMDILSAIDVFCRKNNIKYSLGYGTLLGAIRHGGYIPWDDDIDIIMLREDFNKFEKCFPDILDGRYVFNTLNREKKWHASFGKVSDSRTLVIERKAHTMDEGVNIDVFPLDDAPIDSQVFAKEHRLIKMLMFMHMFKIIKITSETSLPKRIFSILVKCLLLPFRKNFFLDIVVKRSGKFNNSDMPMAYYWPSIDNSSPIEKCLFDNICDISFEGRNYMSIRDYNTYLTSMYGADYMTPPPENKRTSFHTNDAYWI